jgi:hypothetical protein
VLKKGLIEHLRAKRTIRRFRHASLKGNGLGQIKDAVSTRERPASVEDRAVPGHWEGDLIGGSRNSNGRNTCRAPFALRDSSLRVVDHATQAREAIAQHGLTYTDRFNSPRKRTEVSAAESATIAFARLSRELDLDCTSPSAATPPPAIHSNRKYKKRLDKRRSAISENEAAWLRGDYHCGFIGFKRDEELQELWYRHGNHEALFWEPGMSRPERTNVKSRPTRLAGLIPYWLLNS